jgi:hypothetical protein
MPRPSLGERVAFTRRCRRTNRGALLRGLQQCFWAAVAVPTKMALVSGRNCAAREKTFVTDSVTPGGRAATPFAEASALSIGAAPVEVEEERAAQYRTQDHA